MPFSSFDQDFNIDNYLIRPPDERCKFSDCNLYGVNSMLYSGPPYTHKFISDANSIYTFTVNTSDPYVSPELTFGCTIDGSPREKPIIAHSINFTTSVIADCSNTSNFKSVQMPPLLYTLQNETQNILTGNTTDDVFWQKVDLTSGYLLRPSTCHFG